MQLLKGFGKKYFTFSAILATSVKKACHCNCVYNLKTKLALISYKYIPRCPFYTSYFAFRRSGVHPPFLKL